MRKIKNTIMKNIFLGIFAFISFTGYCQISLGTTTPNSSAMMDVTSTTQGLLPPRMTTQQRDAIVNPASGLIIFNTDKACLEWFNGTSWYDSCSNTPTLTLNTALTGFNNEDYIKGVANGTTNTFKVQIENNSSFSSTVSFSPADLILTGPGAAGLTVTVSPTSAVLNTGSSQTITYTLTGTSTATGAINAAWSKLTLSNSGTVTVKELSQLIEITTQFTGNYFTMTPLNNSPVTPRLSVLLKNNSTRSLSFPGPAVGNVVTSLTSEGTANPNVTVSAVSTTSAFTLAPAATLNILYTLSCATPFNSRGTLNAQWTLSSLSTTPTQVIDWLDSGFQFQNSCQLAGDYIVGVPMTAQNKFSFMLTDNLWGVAINNVTAPQASNISINGGNSIGLGVGTASPSTNYNLTSSVNGQTISYPFSGTPTIAGSFPFAMNYVNGGFLYSGNLNIKTITDYLGMNTIPITPPAVAYTGTFINGTSFTGHTISITITNKNSFTSTTLTAPSASDISFPYATGVTVSSVSPTGTYTLAAGASRTFIYTLSGTPVCNNCGDIFDFVWNYCGAGFAVTKNLTHIPVTSSGASVNGSILVSSALSGTTFTVTLTNPSTTSVNNIIAPKITDLTLNYTGTGNLTVTAVSPSIAFNLAANATTTITYTLSGTPSSLGKLTANWLYANNQLSETASKFSGVNFDYTGGNQSFIVPTGATSVTFSIKGAAGGNAGTALQTVIGGNGALVTGTFPVDPVANASYLVVVGGKPTGAAPYTAVYGGGGQGGIGNTFSGGAGGGYSAIFSTTDPIAVAGGGGGGAYCTFPSAANGTKYNGGAASTRGSFAGYAGSSEGGFPGTLTQGGAAGSGVDPNDNNPTAGLQYQGGTGGSKISTTNQQGGGGGGAGYFGGGGGAAGGMSIGSGAGGSSFTNSSVPNPVIVNSSNNGNGAVSITFN